SVAAEVAARVHERAGATAGEPARAIRARDRRAGRGAGPAVRDRTEGARREGAADPARSAQRRAATAARYRVGRTRNGRGQRTDRRRQGGVLSESDAYAWDRLG